jgi:hypothetical protein
MTLLERRTVSRKTPGDGRLEITKETARRLEGLAESIDVDLAGEALSAALGTLPCTCRGAEKPHVHYFLQSDGFRRLTPGDELELALEGGRLSLSPATSPKA